MSKQTEAFETIDGAAIETVNGGWGHRGPRVVVVGGGPRYWGPPPPRYYRYYYGGGYPPPPAYYYGYGW